MSALRPIEHWWNESWARLYRRDIWLLSDGTRWRVEARQGDSDREKWGRDFGADEAGARVLVEQMKGRGATVWRQLV